MDTMPFELEVDSSGRVAPFRMTKMRDFRLQPVTFQTINQKKKYMNLWKKYIFQREKYVFLSLI